LLIADRDSDDGRRLGGAIGLRGRYKEDSGVVGTMGGDTTGGYAQHTDVGQIFDVPEYPCGLDLEEQLLKRFGIGSGEGDQLGFLVAEACKPAIGERQLHKIPLPERYINIMLPFRFMVSKPADRARARLSVLGEGEEHGPL
jgi:hypothetical protein